MTKSVQSELRRVGCLSADADGNWNTTSQRSLTLFNRYAKTKLDTKLASTDALDTIKTKTSRVCPLVCDQGYKAEGESCVKITCAEGSFLNDDNQCEKRREKKPVAKRDTEQDRPAKQRPQATASRGDSYGAGAAGGYGGACGAGAGVAKRAAGGGAGGSVFCNSRAAVRSRAAATWNIAAAAAPAMMPTPRFATKARLQKTSRRAAHSAALFISAEISSRSRSPRCSPSARAARC